MKTTTTNPSTSILTTLESAANQILAAVAPTTVRLARVAVVISDEAETASTDGVVRIRMPVTFCNVSVADEVEVAVGLLVHEIGHFLQPLAAVDTVEQAEAIPRWLTNVALDVQGEALLQSLFPTFKLPLTRVRRVVHRAHLTATRPRSGGRRASPGSPGRWRSGAALLTRTGSSTQTHCRPVRPTSRVPRASCRRWTAFAPVRPGCWPNGWPGSSASSPSCAGRLRLSSRRIGDGAGQCDRRPGRRPAPRSAGPDQFTGRGRRTCAHRTARRASAPLPGRRLRPGADPAQPLPRPSRRRHRAGPRSLRPPRCGQG
jgi:hypothetical protein